MGRFARAPRVDAPGIRIHWEYGPAWPRGRIRAQREEYFGKFSFDTDGDGKTDTDRKLPERDLYFKHRKRSSAIWLQSLPLSGEMAEKELRVLAQHYVEAASGGTSIRLGSAVNERRYSTRILETRETQVAGQPALEFTFEMANVDQLELSKDSRARIVRVVMMRPGFDLRVDDADYRILLVVAHAAMPDDFNHTLADFASLIGRVGLYPDAALDGAAQAVFACLEGHELDSVRIKVAVGSRGAVTGRSR